MAIPAVWSSTPKYRAITGRGTPRFCIAAASATIRCRPARRLRPNIADRLVLACKSPTSKALTLATAPTKRLLPWPSPTRLSVAGAQVRKLYNEIPTADQNR